MSYAPNPPVAGRSNGQCSCVGPCTGYSTRSNCPPLIVLAVIAVSDAASSDAKRSAAVSTAEALLPQPVACPCSPRL